MKSGEQIILSVSSLVLAMVSVQAGSSFAKSLFPEIGAFGTSGVRIALSSIILLIIHRPWRNSFSGPQIKAALFYGLSLGVMNVSFYQAIARIPLGLAVGIEFLGPLTVALMTSRKIFDVFWALIALCGFIFLMPEQTPASSLSSSGVFFAVGAAVAWGCYIIAGKSAGDVLPGGLAVSTGMLFANVVSLPAALLESGMSILSPSILWLGLLVAVFSSALPYSLEMVALRRLPSYTFGILMSIEPAVAAIIGFLMLGEVLTIVQIAGLAAVITASLGASLQSHLVSRSQ